MDPIDRMANAFGWHCLASLAVYVEIDGIIDSSDTMADAFKILDRKGYTKYVNLEQLETIAFEIGRMRRCLDSMDEIKRLARKVFAVNFSESDALFVFNQEVSFSYACKMMSMLGPTLAHFSNFPTQTEVVRAELRLAMSTPFSKILGPESELLCLETMSVTRTRP